MARPAPTYAESAELTFGRYLAALRVVAPSGDLDGLTPAAAVPDAETACRLADVLGYTHEGGPVRFKADADAVAFGRAVWAGVCAVASRAMQDADAARERAEDALLFFPDTSGPAQSIEKTLGLMEPTEFAAMHDLPLSSVLHYRSVRGVVAGWKADMAKRRN